MRGYRSFLTPLPSLKCMESSANSGVVLEFESINLPLELITELPRTFESAGPVARPDAYLHPLTSCGSRNSLLSCSAASISLW